MGFNVQRVHASNYAEVAFFAPIGAPGVTDIPELSAVFVNAPSDDGDNVVRVVHVGRVDVHAACVVVAQIASGVDAACDGTTGDDFVLHGGFTGDRAEFGDAIDFGVVLCPAAFA